MCSSDLVLLQEAENREVKEYLQPGAEYAPYTAGNLEAVVADLLADEAKRTAIAEAAKDRARWLTFDALVQVALAVGGKGWSEVKERARDRVRNRVKVPLSARVWQRAALAGPDADPDLRADLVAAGDRHSLGALANSPAEAESHFTAGSTSNRVSAVGRAFALAELGRRDEALAELKRVVAELDARSELTAQEADAVPYPVRFDRLRADWDRAGYDRPDDPAAERREKARHLRGRALELVAELTDDPADWTRAVVCLPDYVHLRVTLGAALVRAGKSAEAIETLRAALEANPFDNTGARALAAALLAVGRTDEAEQLRAQRRVLATAAPKLVAEIEPLPAPLAAPPAAAAPVPAPPTHEPETAPTPEAAAPVPEPPTDGATTTEPTTHEPPPAEPATPAPAETGPLAEQPPAAPASDPTAEPTPDLRRAPIAEPIAHAQPPAPQPEPPTPKPTPTPPSRPRSRFVDLPQGAFAARFGHPDTRAALAGFTPAHDTHAVLTLVAHARPRRVLEIGTAAGHMTANLTAFTPPEAVVYSIGVVAEDGPRSGTPHQDYEVPRRDQFARFVNHFGTAHKALLVTADSRAYDFARLAPLDLAFVDGGHDLATARSDSLGAYAALRPGGILIWHDVPSPTPWVEVEAAIDSLAFPEPVYRIGGTEVAFLVKGEGIGAFAPEDSAAVALTWDGAIDVAHSLAVVNRALCSELIARGHRLALAHQPPGGVPAAPLPVPPELAERVGRELPGAVHVRHRWPPDFTPPAHGGPFVLIQPWEFGRIPRAWVGPIVETVDELWVPSRSVLRAYVASGVTEDRVVVVPNGIDPDHFRPDLEPLALPTDRRVKLLFVGGTITRKGFDVLLGAYARAFTRDDDVCLVVKDAGAGTFYRDQTAEGAIGALRTDPNAPEVLHLTDDLSEAEVPRLYAACDALVHPYRGEGFALPVLEAMACGLPVVVTAGGPTDEFVPRPACWRVPARLRYFDREAVGDLATVGRPWWLEPDPDALVAILRDVASHADERRRRGIAARHAALGYTWARAASAVEDRVRVLRTRTPVRFRHRAPAAVPLPPRVAPVRAESLPTPAPFAPAVTLGPDEPFVVSAGANSAPAEAPRVTIPAVAGKPRVSLTMIVKNEEHHLPACLASVRDLVDEAVVIDTGSSDRTREIARSFNCVVREFPWVDHFAAARNAALDAARGDYAFWMDADDRLDEDNRTKLKALFDSLPTDNAAFVMKCLCVGEGAGPNGTGSGGAGTAVDHVRLFRLHPAHRWTYRVHEQILPALRATGADVRWSDVCVRHVGYVDPTVRRRKLDRDLRLLKLDAAEKPDDPFTLFNLGSVYHELGDARAAAEALERSLAGSHPKDSIVRKTYALLARCRQQAGDPKGAEAVCRRGRTHYPDDAELVFLAAGYAREAGDHGAAEGLYRKLIDGSEGPHFASVDTGLRAVKGRHNLAVMLLERERFAEAEGLWRAALSHDPQFLPAQVGLGEVYVHAKNRAGLDRQIAALEGFGGAGSAEAAVLAARWESAQGNHASAAAILEGAVARLPGALGVRVALSHVRIAAGAPPALLEAAFTGVLELDPNNAQAKHNLAVLYHKTGRTIEGVIDTPPSA